MYFLVLFLLILALCSIAPPIVMQSLAAILVGYLAWRYLPGALYAVGIIVLLVLPFLSCISMQQWSPTTDFTASLVSLAGCCFCALCSTLAHFRTKQLQQNESSSFKIKTGPVISAILITLIGIPPAKTIIDMYNLGTIASVDWSMVLPAGRHHY